MNQERILVSSVTYAIKGRDLLRANGFKAYIERSGGELPHHGCSYTILVGGNIDLAEQILRDNHIRILGRTGGGAG